jgi:hypothetical protein
MEVIGFINEDEIVSRITDLSDNYMLFYLPQDMEDQIRAVNHTAYVQFFDTSTGNQINLKDQGMYTIIDGEGNRIFHSDEKVPDGDIVFKYAMLDKLYNGDSSSIS